MHSKPTAKLDCPQLQNIVHLLFIPALNGPKRVVLASNWPTVAAPLHYFLWTAAVRVSPLACPEVRGQSAFHHRKSDHPCARLTCDVWSYSQSDERTAMTSS